MALAATVAVARVSGTYGVLSETFDEPLHIAAGMEFVDQGRFQYEPQHPPLGRSLIALGPYLDGRRSTGLPSIRDEGRAILYASDVSRTLTLARLGILPFLLLAIGSVWALARRTAGEAAAVLAVFAFTLSPPVLAHAGVATTDMPGLGTLLALVVVAISWLEHPTRARGVLLGVAGAAAIGAKLSVLPFFGALVALVLVIRWWWSEPRTWNVAGFSRSHWSSLVLAVPVAFLVLWGIYGWQHGTLRGVPFPLTALIQGVRDVAAHNEYGHASYALGTGYFDGRWYFFPLALAVKTPLTILSFGLIGCVLLVQRARAAHDWRLLVVPLVGVAVLAVSIPARINIGVRHVLAVYAVLAVGTGISLVAAWEAGTRWQRAMVAVVALAGLVSTFRVHPDYLAYFNELAGPRPERILVDSDLDWGQDLARLRDTVRARGIDTLTLAYFGTALPGGYGVPAAPWKEGERAHGWFAVSQTLLQRGPRIRRPGGMDFRPDLLSFLEGTEPVARVGRSMLLYHLP